MTIFIWFWDSKTSYFIKYNKKYKHMHKISINLHYLKTALIFSMEISRDYSSRHGLRMCQFTSSFFRRSTAEIQGGVVNPPPPPPPNGCEMGSKDPAFLGLIRVISTKYSSLDFLLYQYHNIWHFQYCRGILIYTKIVCVCMFSYVCAVIV